MNIDFDYYKTFYYVAKYSSMSIAAEKMMTNQPNVSRIIKRLERELGCKLFIRNKKGVMLTDSGLKLYEHVKIAIEEIEIAESEVSLNKESETGQITIGISEISIRKHLVPIIKEYQKIHPRITLRLILYPSNNLNLAALKEGKIDISIISDEMELPEKLKLHKLVESNLLVVGGTDYLFLRDRELSVKELSSFPLMCLNAETRIHNVISRFFIENGSELRPTIELASYDQINTLVYCNMGIAIVPEDFVTRAVIQTCSILSLKEKLPKTTTCSVYRIDMTLSPYIKELQHMILNYNNFILPDDIF